MTTEECADGEMTNLGDCFLADLVISAIFRVLIEGLGPQ